MCKRLLENGVAGLHFYTLNLEKSVTHILEGLGYVTELAHHGKNLPWVKVCCYYVSMPLLRARGVCVLSLIHI